MHAQLCLTLCDPLDCSPPGSSVHGILQTRILQWVAISFSRGSSRPRNQTHISCVSCTGRQILYHLGSPKKEWFPSKVYSRPYLMHDWKQLRLLKCSFPPSQKGFKDLPLNPTFPQRALKEGNISPARSQGQGSSLGDGSNRKAISLDDGTSCHIHTHILPFNISSGTSWQSTG